MTQLYFQILFMWKSNFICLNSASHGHVQWRNWIEKFAMIPHNKIFHEFLPGQNNEAINKCWTENLVKLKLQPDMQSITGEV